MGLGIGFEVDGKDGDGLAGGDHGVGLMEEVVEFFLFSFE